MHVTVLTYHSLDDTGSPVSVSPAMFQRHLMRLRAADCTVLPLRQAMARLGQPPPAEERIVALTFDDGFAAVHRHALPLLASYGWKATVFPVSNYVGGTNSWPGQPTSVPLSGLLAWNELRELAGLGWEIGAHSRTHPDLTQLGDRALADEIVGAKAVLEDRLGQPVQTFAYPYGRYDRRVQARVREAYTAACTTVMGIAESSGDRYALERLDMWYFSHGALHHLLLSPWMAQYAVLCRAGRRTRTSLGHLLQASRGRPYHRNRIAR